MAEWYSASAWMCEFYGNCWPYFVASNVSATQSMWKWAKNVCIQTKPLKCWSRAKTNIVETNTHFCQREHSISFSEWKEPNRMECDDSLNCGAQLAKVSNKDVGFCWLAIGRIFRSDWVIFSGFSVGDAEHGRNVQKHTAKRATNSDELIV